MWEQTAPSGTGQPVGGGVGWGLVQRHLLEAARQES